MNRRKPQGYIARAEIHNAIQANTDVGITIARLLAIKQPADATALLGTIALKIINQRTSLDVIRDIICNPKGEPDT